MAGLPPSVVQRAAARAEDLKRTTQAAALQRQHQQQQQEGGPAPMQAEVQAAEPAGAEAGGGWEACLRSVACAIR